MSKWFKTFLEWVGHFEAIQFLIHTEFFRILLLPFIVTGATASFGWIEKMPLMWILMAGALAFMATMQGMLRSSEYRERKSPRNKLSYEGTFFSAELDEIDVPHHLIGNRRQRRNQRQQGQEIPRLSSNQVMAGVNRHVLKGQLSVAIKNNATFPISWYLESADTEINGIRADRKDYPTPPIILQPGNSVRALDAPVDLDDMECQHLTGKMNFKIRYGLPGKEHFELNFEANVLIPMERFGFVPIVQTEWLS